MLRPATPLSILLLAAFACMLLAVLSTPIIKQIPMASFGGVDFGVFGFCKGTKCSPVEIGYSTAGLFSASQESTFDLGESTRATLSAILIVHPIAAFFILIMLALAIAAHLHAPSHSPRYLLGIFILSIVTLVISLLAFLIDVLLFVPHMSWGSYIVLAATVLIAASGIVSCAMRRTLVSRKARQRRIAENAEMNGENFYNRQAPGPVVPVVANNSAAGEKLPMFATFEGQNSEQERSNGRNSDERKPLTAISSEDNSAYNIPPGSLAMTDRGQQRSQSRDQYGNAMPLQPPGGYGMRRDDFAGPPLNHQRSDPAMGSRGRGGMGGFRGRGGYPPNARGFAQGAFRGRGGYPNNGRGGFPGPYRGAYNNGMNERGMPMGGGMRSRGPPPPDYAGPPGQYGTGYDRRPPQALDGYQDAAPMPQPAYMAYNGDAGEEENLPRAESPPPLEDLHLGPVGQAVEMDASTGSPAVSPAGFGKFGPIRDGDADIAGMVGMQQGKAHRNTVESETSRYSEDEPYVPPRAAWQGDRLSTAREEQAVELPNGGVSRPERSSAYFEDVDPQFSEQLPPIPPGTNSLVPNALAPPPINVAAANRNVQTGGIGRIHSFQSIEELQSGARSPAESERSTFTSVSQRGVNPRWPGAAPAAGGYGGNYDYGAPMPVRRPVPRQQEPTDLLLNSNPDFQLPGGRGKAATGMGRGLRGGSAYPSL